MYTGQLPPISNQATWTEAVEVIDTSTGTVKDLSAVTEITMKVRDSRAKSHVLSATLSGGEITIPSAGTFQWTFSASTMSRISPGDYEIGVTFDEGGETTQLLIGTAPILDGIVG